MTAKEHFLMLTLFTKQMQLLRILRDAMKHHGVSVDDLEALEFAATSDPQAMFALQKRMWTEYVGLAKAMGIDTGGLENHPPPSTEDSSF
jgi:hypothetical protein